MVKRVGISCLPGRGHLYPAMALGRCLKAKGYEIVVFNSPITQTLIASAGLTFEPLDEGWGELEPSPWLSSKRYSGPNTLNVMRRHAQLMLTQGPRSLRRRDIQALLVDQADLAGGTVAEFLGIPFISLSFFPPVYLDDSAPPFIFDWQPTGRSTDESRNRRGNTLLRLLTQPILDEVNSYRVRWGLHRIADLNGVFSQLSLISQMPKCLELPREGMPSNLIYTGPFVDPIFERTDRFPWDKINEKPLIYASLGTVRSESMQCFEPIAEAAHAFDIQLVMSLGGMTLIPDDFKRIPSHTILVHYAPQIELLRRACLTICHGGMNTTLESAAAGVPIIALPITDDQPGVAARIKWHGMGVAIPMRRLSVQNLRAAIETVLGNTSFTSAVRRVQAHIESAQGLHCAADLIDRILGAD